MVVPTVEYRADVIADIVRVLEQGRHDGTTDTFTGRERYAGWQAIPQAEIYSD